MDHAANAAAETPACVLKGLDLVLACGLLPPREFVRLLSTCKAATELSAAPDAWRAVWLQVRRAGEALVDEDEWLNSGVMNHTYRPISWSGEKCLLRCS